MTTYDYSIIAKGDISAGVATGVGNVRNAHLVLPGSTVRGALASVWAREHQNDEGEVDRKALDDMFERALIFSQAVPESVFLEPMSLGHCKYRNFKRDSLDPDGGTTRFDAAFMALNGKRPPATCTCGCEQPWEYGKGWAGGGNLRGTRTSTQLNEHGRALSSALFTREHVRQACYTGTITIRPEVGLSPEALDWLKKGTQLRLGGRRTVQGAAKFDVVDPPNDVPATTRADFLTRTDQRAVLRLLSPAILVDEFGAPTTSIASVLRQVFGDGVLVEGGHSWQRTERITTWHARARLPRPVETALAAGSTWVVAGLPANARARIACGIGLRTGEGYGQVVLLEESDIAAGAPGQRADESTLAGTPPAEPVTESELGPAPLVSQTSALIDDLRQLGQSAVIASVWRQAKWIAEMPAQGRSALRAAKADQVLNYPWAKALPTAVREAIRHLLADEEDLAAAVSELESAKGKS